MGIELIIALSFVALGVISLIHPFHIIFLLTAYPVLSFLPSLSKEEGQFKIIQIGSLNIYVSDYLILLLFMIALIVAVKTYLQGEKKIKTILLSPISKIAFFLFLWNIFIGILSVLKGYQVQNVIRLLSSEFAVVIVVLIPLLNNIETKKDYFFNYSVFLGVILAVFGAVRYFITHEIELTSSGTIRTLLGYTINIFILPLCYILFYGKYWHRHKILSFFIILILALGISFAGHRSGWLVLFFILTIYFFSSNFDKIKYLWIPLFAISIVLSAVLISPFGGKTPGDSILSDIFIRVKDTFDLNNKTTRERISKWSLSLDIVKEKPILGLGRLPVSTASIESKTNRHLKYFSEFDKDAHNLFATKIAHEGVIGLIVLLTCLFLIFYNIKNLKYREDFYGTFIKSYLLAFILLSMFNATFDNMSCKIYFYIILGFLNSAIIVEGKNQLNNDTKFVATNTLLFKNL